MSVTSYIIPSKTYVDTQVGNLAGAGNTSTVKANADNIATLSSAKADKVTSPVTGHFAGLNASGNLTDSGYNSASFTAASHVGTTGSSHGVATTSVNGFMSSADKTKLNGIATNANNYSLPTASSTTLGGVKIGTGVNILEGVISVSTAYAPSSHVGATGTAHGAATTTVNGFMSSADKTKLNGIATNANNYSLPTATDTTLGGVKIGSGVTITSGVISVSTNYQAPLSNVSTGATQVILNGNTVRGLKQGSNVTITQANDVITINSSYTNTTYSASTGLSLTGTAFSVKYGTTAGTACQGDDTRLADARTPVAHNHAAGDINSGTLSIARIPTGNTSATVCIGNDSRLSNARTPVAHNHAAGDINSGTLSVGRGGTGATTFTSGNVLIGAGTGAVTTLSRSGIDSRSSFPPSSHSHGSLTNDGKVGATANLVVVTGTGGAITTASRSGIDSRSSFPPSTHTHSYLPLSGGTLTGALTGTSASLTSLSLGTSSKATNGYTMLPNGLLLQWGYGTGAITFPLTFKTLFSITASMAATRRGDRAPRIGYQSVSGFRFYLPNSDGTVYENQTCYWMAIGEAL